MAEKRIDWSPRHGPVSGSINTALGLGAFTAANDAFTWGISPWWAVGLAGVGAAASYVHARATNASRAVRAYRLFCWAGAGAWTTYALHDGVWDVNTLLAGGGLALTAGLLAPAVALRQHHVREHARQTAAEQQRWSEARQWTARLERVANIKGARVVAIEPWIHPDPDRPGKERQTGYTVDVELPLGGASWENLAVHTARLAADLRLPHGCGLEVRPGVDQGRALVDVTTLNVLDGDIPLVEPETLPATINDPLTVGLYSNRSLVRLPLRWTSAVLVGAKRQGKSNLLKTVTRQALRCNDVLVMGIDPNGGAVFKPFLRPWLEGRTRRPAIDWVATTAEEAELMLTWLIGAVERRRAGYSDYMWQKGGDDKLAVSHEIPQILLLTDESKSLPRSVKTRLVELNDRCGAASISMLTSWLRAVAQGMEGLPTDLLAQSETRLSVRMNTHSELQRLFGQATTRVTPAPAPGWGHAVATAGQRPMLYKASRSQDADAYQDAVTCDEWRPAMDEITLGEGEVRRVYEERWQRALAHGWLGVPSLPGTAASSSPAARPATPPEPTRPRRSSEKRRQAAIEVRNRLRRLSGRPPLDENGHEIDDVDQRFSEIVAGLAPEGTLPLLLTAALAVFDEEDTDQVHRQVLAERLTGGDKDRLTALFRAIGIAPLPTPFRMPGRGTGRGYSRQAVEAAAAEIREGHRRVPDEVADWSPPL